MYGMQLKNTFISFIYAWVLQTRVTKSGVGTKHRSFVSTIARKFTKR